MSRLTMKFTDGTFYCEEIEDVGIEGINAPTYVGKAVDKLADYEDKEEQGLLIELKVPLGTRIWYIEEDYHDNTFEISTTFYDFRWLYCHKDEEFYLTQAEAEEALAKTGGQ